MAQPYVLHICNTRDFGTIVFEGSLAELNALIDKNKWHDRIFCLVRKNYQQPARPLKNYAQDLLCPTCAQIKLPMSSCACSLPHPPALAR